MSKRSCWEVASDFEAQFPSLKGFGIGLDLLSGLWLMGRLRPSPRVERWLRHIPDAVLIPIVAPVVAAGGPPELLAVLAAAAVEVGTAKMLLTMLVGVGVVWAMRLRRM
jgi:uncharacterized membrane protein